MAMVLLLGFVAHRKGWSEVILGAFLAGAILNLVDRESLSHPNLRLKLEAIGYGFVVPVFFIASGPRFDLQALLDRPSAALKVPLFLLALLLVREVPAAVHANEVGRRGAVSAGCSRQPLCRFRSPSLTSAWSWARSAPMRPPRAGIGRPALRGDVSRRRR